MSDKEQEASPGRRLLHHLLLTEEGLETAVVLFTSEGGVYVAHSAGLPADRVRTILQLGLEKIAPSSQEPTP